MEVEIKALLGHCLEDRLESLKSSNVEVIVKETFSPKRQNSEGREARILRALEKDKTIELTVGYF